MKFAKDILMLDFEGYHQPVQVGAILLDKETLEEKDTFSTYIFSDLDGRTSEITGINQQMLEGAPSQAEAGRMLVERFGTDVMIACWVSNLDWSHLKKLLAAAGMDPETYDHHVLDLWPAAYVHLLKRGYTGGIRSEEMFQAFGAPPRGSHDALEDCRIAADILRKLIATDAS